MVNVSKGSAMTKAMSIMRYDAMGLGEIDFGIGWESIKTLMEETDFPILSANIVRDSDGAQELFAKPFTILEIENGKRAEKVAVLSLTDPAEFAKLASFRVDDLEALDPLQALQPIMKDILAITDRVICLSTMSRELEIEVAKQYPEIDIIIGAKAPFFSSHPVYIKGEEERDLVLSGEDLKGGTLIVSGLDRGRSMGMLDVLLDEAGDIQKYRSEILGIGLKDYEEDPEVKALLLSYDNDMKEDDAAAAMKEYSELITHDNSHLRNITAIEEMGEKGKEAYDKGDYAKALELLSTAKDSLLMRESAKAKWDDLESEMKEGLPENLPTTKLFSQIKEAKRLYDDRYFPEAKKKFVEAHFTLERLHRIKESFEKYNRGKDLLMAEGIDLTMSDKARTAFEKALQEEKLSDAVGILQRANMKIRKVKNVIKWRNITGKLLEDIGEDALKDSLASATKAKADSLYANGSFTESRKYYDKLAKMLEPLIVREEGQPTATEIASQTSDDNRYVGSEKCRSCHEQEYEHWSSTRHSSAFDKLDENSKSDPECVQCHVVGFGSDDGYKIGGERSGLNQVGCESCHGRGYLHITDEEHASMDRSVDPGRCTSCHDKNQGFSFDYFPMLVAVLHK